MSSKNGKPKTIEERMHAMERDQTEMRVRHNTMERAIGSLIATHPAPEVFATHFAKVTNHVFNGHLYDALVTDEAREHSRQLAQELVQLAQDETTRREAQSRCAG